MYVEIGDDHIGIYKTKGRSSTEIVYWHKDEWMEDPETVVPAIANAINLAYKDPKQLEEILQKLKKERGYES